MGWNEDAVIDAAHRVDAEGTLWILFLAQNDEVGIWKTSNLQTLESSVRKYAQEIGLPDPGKRTVRDGYDKIEHRSVVDADGAVDTINNDDKSNDIVRLTPLGQNLVAFVNKDNRVRNLLKDLVGADIEDIKEPWWPYGPPNEDSPLHIRTYADRSVLDESQTKIYVIVSFDCPNCKESIEDLEFEVKMQDGDLIEWGRTEEVECLSCGSSIEICPIDQHREPEEIL